MRPASLCKNPPSSNLLKRSSVHLYKYQISYSNIIEENGRNT